MTDAIHLSPDELDLWLDGRLPDQRASHLETCEFCRTATDELAEVVGLLQGLPRLAPSESFSELVMARVRLPEAAGHLAGDDLDHWIAGTLPRGREGHLRACPDCQRLADAERMLVLRLEALPLFDPRAGFADRVMEQVELPVTSLAGAWNRWRRAVARNPLTVGMAAGIGGVLGGSMAASIAWASGNQDMINGAGTWLMTQSQTLFWQGVTSASLVLEQQAWYHALRSGLTPGRIAAVGGLAITLYAAGVIALRRLLALPSTGPARALP